MKQKILVQKNRVTKLKNIHHQIFTKALGIFILVCFSITSIQAITRYVKPVAAGIGDGSTWGNASANLQAMIQTSSVGDEIWVAAGTYLPTNKPYDSGVEITTSDIRDKTFHIKNGVKIYGGFAGTESALSQRLITTNVTILSGDIGTAGDASDNCYHVLFSYATASGGIGVTIDGFTITGGNANATSFITIDVFVNINRGRGGGILLASGTNTMINNTVSGNTAFSGGGIFVSTGSTSNTNNFKNNIFWGNKKGTSSNVVSADFEEQDNLNLTSNIFTNNILQLDSINYTSVNKNAVSAGSSGNIFASAPLFVNPSDIDGPDNIHRNADDGLQLQGGSPAMNTGTATGAPITDITGATRIGLPDIGAYEILCVTTTATINQSICSGSSYMFNGIAQTTAGIYLDTITNAGGCDSIVTLNLTVMPGVLLSAKALLLGAYDSITGKMHDSLRVKNLIPGTEPYTTSPFNKAVLGDASGETVSASVLGVTGYNAIVDWVFIELRSASNSTTVVATKRALIQRDGDIVSAEDGISPVKFSTTPAGDYFISIKHRNHLGIMSLNAISLNACTTTAIDFTNSNNVYTIPAQPLASNYPARKQIGSTYLMWSGDALRNKNIKYNGLSNDKDFILTSLGGPLVVPSVLNNTLDNVYRSEDHNLDGKIRYNGTDNDRTIILSNLGNQSNNIINQHTPN